MAFLPESADAVETPPLAPVSSSPRREASAAIVLGGKGARAAVLLVHNVERFADVFCVKLSIQIELFNMISYIMAPALASARELGRGLWLVC